MRSQTYGKVEMAEIARIIKSKVEANPHKEFNLVVGTDSQNFDKTKVVVVIALHMVGSGGIFFYDINYVRRLNSVGEKLRYETTLSLDYVMKLVDELDKLKETENFDYEDYVTLTIHVDAGPNGLSNKVIPEIVGWINACGYKAVTKPESFAASCIANKYSK